MYKDDDTCLAKVGEKEPIFVLRAQDALAPQLVDDWAVRLRDEAIAAGSYTHDRRAKVEHAHRLARAMRDWQAHNNVKLPD